LERGASTQEISHHSSDCPVISQEIFFFPFLFSPGKQCSRFSRLRKTVIIDRSRSGLIDDQLVGVSASLMSINMSACGCRGRN
jgi:hypothetical protein